MQKKLSGGDISTLLDTLDHLIEEEGTDHIEEAIDDVLGVAQEDDEEYQETIPQREKIYRALSNGAFQGAKMALRKLRL
jgi:hypothetical protein